MVYLVGFICYSLKHITVVSNALSSSQPVTPAKINNPNNDDSALYFLNKGPRSHLPDTFQFHPLSMHVNEQKRKVESSDKKYFLRIFGSAVYDEHCWIRVNVHIFGPLVFHSNRNHAEILRATGGILEFFADTKSATIDGR